MSEPERLSIVETKIDSIAKVTDTIPDTLLAHATQLAAINTTLQGMQKTLDLIPTMCTQLSSHDTDIVNIKDDVKDINNRSWGALISCIVIFISGIVQFLASKFRL